MKVLILIKKWEGGVGSYARNVKREFEKQGVVVEVVSREDDLKLFGFVGSFFPLINFVSQKKYDDFVVYSQDWSLALPMIIGTNNEHFACFHGFNPGIGKFFQWVTGLLMGSDLVVVNKKFKAFLPKCRVIYEGVDVNSFVDLKQKRKGVGFANWQTSEYNFDLVKTACDELGLELKVAKGLNTREMNLFYNGIETFVSLPPSYTGFGLVWLEAMAAGVPNVIGNGYGISCELSVSNCDGSLEDLKEKIVNNYCEKENYGKYLKFFSWDKHVRELKRVFL